MIRESTGAEPDPEEAPRLGRPLLVVAYALPFVIAATSGLAGWFLGVGAGWRTLLFAVSGLTAGWGVRGLLGPLVLTVCPDRSSVEQATPIPH
jgi:hypothetical protein